MDNTEALEEVKYESARVKYESKFLDFVDPALLPTPKWIPALTDTDFSWCATSFVLRSNQFQYNNMNALCIFYIFRFRFVASYLPIIFAVMFSQPRSTWREHSDPSQGYINCRKCSRCLKQWHSCTVANNLKSLFHVALILLLWN